MNRQEVEVVIPEWWSWWRWLGYSPTVWKASHEGLKALTPIPNPIRISPQMQVTCGWKKLLMHKHYNLSVHQYFLYFVTLFGCLLIDYVIWNLFVCFCILSYKLSSILFLINLFILMCQKSKNHIKSRKSKVWLTLLSFVPKLALSCTFVLMALCIYECSLFLCTLIIVEEILKSIWLL